MSTPPAHLIVALGASLSAMTVGCNGAIGDATPDEAPPAGDSPTSMLPPTDDAPPTPPDPLPLDPNGLDQRRLFECGARSAPPRTAPRVLRLTPSQLAHRWPRGSERRPPFGSDPRYRYSTDARDAYVDDAALSLLIQRVLEIGPIMVARRAGWPRCLDDPAPDLECLKHWARGHLTEALRRPPSEEEAEDLGMFALDAIGRSGFEEGLALAAARPFVGSSFLFRTELGRGEPDADGRRLLGPFELATAIAYATGDDTIHTGHAAFWTAPEEPREAALDALEAAAAADALRTPDEIEGHVRALVDATPPEDAPILPANVLRFFREYLGYSEVSRVFKSGPYDRDRDYRPGYFERQLDAMVSQAVIDDDDVLGTLLTSRSFWFAPVAPDAERVRGAWPFNLEGTLPTGVVEMPADQRSGVLTHPGWLASHSGNQHVDPHPVHRGKWIRENMLCETVPDVPIGVDARLPEFPDATVRERLAAATSPEAAPENEYCWSCHRLMDPLGIPFEMFDHYGRFRREEVLGDETLTAPVDASSTLLAIDDPVLDGAHVEDALEMMALFAESERVELCFLRQMFRFFVGRPETYEDACTLARMRDVHLATGGSFREVLVALLTSDSFLYRDSEFATAGGE